MKAFIVDPPAFTPPYDHALAGALAAAGIETSLVTASFSHGPVPEPSGYAVDEFFYRRSSRLTGPARRGARALEHLPDMARFRRFARGADIVHYMWLSVPQIDQYLLGHASPRLMTMHWRLPDPESIIGRTYARLLKSMDHVIIHTQSGRDRLVSAFGVDPDRISVIPMGAFDYLTRLPNARPLPPELSTSRPVILAFGLIRPYKRTELLIEAMHHIPDAELWIVGNPRMNVSDLRQAAERVGDRVRFIDRFVPDDEVPAFFERADIVALPYDHIEQSAVLYTALAFGNPLVLSDVGGFPEIGEAGAAMLFPSGHSDELADALKRLLHDDALRRRLSSRARELAETEYSWLEIGNRTAAVYRHLAATC